MSNMRIPVVILSILLIISAAPPANARWETDGTAVSVASGTQYVPSAASDGSGGAIIAWRDSRSGNNDIYAQRIDAYGRALWTADGVAICTASNAQYNPYVLSDGSGGAFIAWHDNRTGNYDIYAQRIDSDGSVQWTSDGVAVCTVADNQNNPRMVSDDEDGVIVCWYGYHGGAHFDIYAQRLDPDGNTLWAPGGVPVIDYSAHQAYPVMIPDGEGGAIVAWNDFRGGIDYDVYAQRINSSGSVLWTANGEPVCVTSGTQNEARIIPDEMDGAIIVWQDRRNGTDYNIYAQRIDEYGSVMWSVNGEAACKATDDQLYPQAAVDGSGGAYIVWQDGRNVHQDIYAQHITQYGGPTWAADGEVVCVEANDQTEPQMISNGFGGAIITWSDERFMVNGKDIYCQFASIMGDMKWYSGYPICGAEDRQHYPQLVVDDERGAIFTWIDERDGSESDIYAQRMLENGYWGYPAPIIFAVRDTPGDQGGYVNIAWDSGYFDTLPYQLVYYYSIWKAIDPLAALCKMEAGAEMITDYSEFSKRPLPENSTTTASNTEDLSSDGTLIRMSQEGAQYYYWEFVTTQDANCYPGYSKRVLTDFDSTAVCDEYHYFQVCAHTTDPYLTYTSPPDSGYSVDNLAPCPPLALAGEQLYTPEGLQLTWARNTESDLDCYRVYRVEDEFIEPGPEDLLGSPCDTTAFDGTWSWDGGYWYKVAAVDIHGNESPFAVIGPNAVTGGDPMPVPEATFLAQNWPNPLNPVTNIGFGIKEPAHVSLRIYDAAGRLVTTLIDETRAAGQYETVWNGTDGTGGAAASGVYFYMLKAGPFEETKKMILLR